jgi:hypothetical protein
MIDVRGKRWAATCGTFLAALLVSGAGPVRALQAPQATPDPAGRWVLALEGAFASQSWTLEVGRDAGALTATLVLGTMGSADLEDVTLEGDTLSGHFTANMHGQEVHVTVRSAIRGDACEGAVTGFPMGDVAFEGRREKG